MKHYKAVPFSDSRYALAESPFSDSRTGIISYVDITPGRFYRLFPNGKRAALNSGSLSARPFPRRSPGHTCWLRQTGFITSRTVP